MHKISRRYFLTQASALLCTASLNTHVLANVLSQKNKISEVGRILIEEQVISKVKVERWLDAWPLQSGSTARFQKELQERIEQDREVSELVWLDGWALSKTEAYFFASQYLYGISINV